MTDAAKEPVIDLLCEMIRRRSVTPADAGCQPLMAERLARLGFDCETLQFNDVTNLWARRGAASFRTRWRLSSPSRVAVATRRSLRRRERLGHHGGHQGPWARAPPLAPA